MAGEELGHELQGPLLERLGHDGVVGVGDRLGGERPGGVPVHTLVIHEDAHELGAREGRVGVVHLDRNLLGELGPVGVTALLEPSEDVLHGRRAEHVLLGEAERLALAGGVAGVEHRAERGREVGLPHGLVVVARVEGGEVELLGRHLGVPQAEGDGVLGLVAGDGGVVSDGADVRTRDPLPVHDFSVEADGVLRLPLHLPRVTDLEPVVGVLLLDAVLDGLLEQAVLVAEAVAPRGEIQRGDGVEEARGEAAETAVAESHVALHARGVLERIAEGAEGVGVLAGEAEVTHGVGQRTALEELHGDVVRLLGVLVVEVPVGGVPVLHELLLDGLGGGAVHGVDAELDGHDAGLDGLRREVVGDGFRGLGRHGRGRRGGSLVNVAVCSGSGGWDVGGQRRGRWVSGWYRGLMSPSAAPVTRAGAGIWPSRAPSACR